MITIEQLRRYALFDTAPDEIAADVVAQSEEAVYAPGEVIIAFGQPFTFFGLILEGEACANTPVDQSEGEALCVEKIKTGGNIGAMSLMTGLPSPVDVVATTPCRVLLVPADLFRRWIQADPAALQRFAKIIAKRSTLIEKVQQEHSRKLAEPGSDADPYGLSLAPGPSGPQKVLVINVRSGSLKYRFFDTADESHNVEGQVEWIDQPGTLQTHTAGGKELKFELGGKKGADHKQALQAALDRLIDPKVGVIHKVSDITAVGHRVVHGSDKYSNPVEIDDKVLADIRRFGPLAPLHNPIQAQGIESGS